jgi:GDP-D-mannose dehydratase
MGSGIQYSNFHIYDIFKSIINKDAPVAINDSLFKNFENNVWVCDTKYAKDVYGFETKFSIKDGIEDYIKIKMESNIL